MDEYNTGMEPETRDYLKKVIKSFFLGAIWLIAMMTLGLFMGWAVLNRGWQWYNFVFYPLFVATFLMLIRYYYRKWRSDFE